MPSTLLALARLLLPAAALAAQEVTPAMKNFGHAIKNGHLLPGPTEITTFEHNCTAAPCAITQLHCPAAGSEWWATRVKFYVDGEAAPSIDISLAELANIGPWGPATGDEGPWGLAAFGHTASNGGVYSTTRIPFGKSIRSTITNASPKAGTFWFIIRGIESYPVQLGDLTLPAAARLKLHRVNRSTTNLELVTLASVPKGMSGAVLSVLFSAQATAYGYLEACMRAMIDGATEPLFLSSGAEDYFLSAYYFNEGEFKTPNSGLTYYDKKGTLSAYKTHDRDPILFNDGLSLVFRNMEDTTGCGNVSHCPNQYCAPGAAPNAAPEFVTDARAAAHALRPEVDALYDTLVWVYEWPQQAEQPAEPAADQQAAVDFVVGLGAQGLLAEEEEFALLRALLAQDEAGTLLRALIDAYRGAAGPAERAARQLRRWLAK